MRARLAGVLTLGLLAAAAVAAQESDPWRVMTERYAAVETYRARMIRQERVAGVLRPREEALVKFQKPGRLYLRWIDGPPKGREILYVPGRNGDNMLVHEPRGVSGLFTVQMSPDSPRVRAESRHPVTDIGLGRLIELVSDNVERARRRGHLRTVDLGIQEEAGRWRQRFELRFAEVEPQAYYAPRVVVAVDRELGLATAITAFDAGDQLILLYDYRDVEVNATLDARDFDPGNPEYGFPRWRVTL